MDRKALPSDLTSYDFVKFAALALMVVDHVGAFIYMDEQWLRVVGRLSAPIWLFLVGYARSRDFSDRMWIAAAILAGFSYFTGGLLPFSILCTMLLARILIDPLMNFIRQNPSTLYPISVMLFFGTLFTSGLFEYGTCAMLVVMVGYMTRNRESLPFTHDQFLQYTAIVAGGYFLVQAYYFFVFDFYQQIFAGIGLLMVFLGMTAFQPRVYPELTKKMPRPLVWLVQVGGRYSLEFYVAHLILLRAVMTYNSLSGQFVS